MSIVFLPSHGINAPAWDIIDVSMGYFLFCKLSQIAVAIFFVSLLFGVYNFSYTQENTLI